MRINQQTLVFEHKDNKETMKVLQYTRLTLNYLNLTFLKLV